MNPKRRHPRIDLDIPVELRVPDRERLIDTMLGNLGPEGAFVKISKKLETGTRVRLGFKLPSHPLAFDLCAEVRWQRDGAEGGIGVQFIDIPPYDHGALNDYCSHQLEASRTPKLMR